MFFFVSDRERNTTRTSNYCAVLRGVGAARNEGTENQGDTRVRAYASTSESESEDSRAAFPPVLNFIKAGKAEIVEVCKI